VRGRRCVHHGGLLPKVLTLSVLTLRKLSRRLWLVLSDRLSVLPEVHIERRSRVLKEVGVVGSVGLTVRHSGSLTFSHHALLHTLLYIRVAARVTNVSLVHVMGDASSTN
jgi:hypothetical protein